MIGEMCSLKVVSAIVDPRPAASVENAMAKVGVLFTGGVFLSKSDGASDCFGFSWLDGLAR